jgi:hypothetical protein
MLYLIFYNQNVRWHFLHSLFLKCKNILQNVKCKKYRIHVNIKDVHTNAFIYILLSSCCALVRARNVVCSKYLRFQTSAVIWIVVFFLLGDSPVPEFYMPTFRNTLCQLHRDTALVNGTGFSGTTVHKLQKLGNHPKERIWCMICYDMIYLFTALGLTPGGSSTVHIYTHTVHRTT